MGAIIAAVLPVISSIFGKLTDKQVDQIQASLQIALANVDLQKAQIAVNVEQAKSDSIFVAGARPFVEWGCAIALMYNTLIIPLIVSGFAILVLFGVDPHTVANAKATLPVLDVSMLYQVLGSLLGITIYPVMDTVKKVNKYKVDNGV